MKTLTKIEAVLFPAIGIICILWSGHITYVLPYLLGGGMVIVGVWMAVLYARDRKFLNQNSEELVYGIVLFIMGLAFIVKGANAIGPMGTTWAIIGIRKAAKSLNRAVRQIYRKEHFAVPVTEFLLRITLALVLLFDPYEKFSSHIVILGLELIVSSVRLNGLFRTKSGSAADE